MCFSRKVALGYVKNYEERNGSIGAELLGRFVVTLNYKEKWLRLKKGRNYVDPFYYNMSGIELQHNGVRLVENSLPNQRVRNNETEKSDHRYTFFFETQTHYALTQAIEIGNVRPDSPADAAGLQKGDVIIKINGVKIVNQSIENLAQLLNRKPGKKMKLEITRGDDIMKFQFTLKQVLQN